MDDREQRLERRLPLARLVAFGRAPSSSKPTVVRPALADRVREARRPVASMAGPPEARDRGPHLGPVEEAQAADLVRDAGPRQRLLDRRELRVHPDEDRDLARARSPSRSRPRIAATSAASSASAVGVPRDRGLGAVAAGRREPLRAARRGDQPVGELEDLRRRAVVPRRARRSGAPGMPLRERDQVVRRRARERVDRLVLVADDAQVARLAEPQLEQPLLERVRVLVLVDAEPALARADGRGGVGVGLEQLGPSRRACRRSRSGRPASWPARSRRRCRTNRSTGIGGSRPARTAGRALVGRGPDPARLRPLDLVGEVLGRREPVVAGQLAREPAEDRHLRVEQLAAAAAPSWRDGQKWRSWQSAWAWNVRAVTPRQPERRAAARPSRPRPCP